MARFHNYYVLCPLIDQKSFLGVTPDREAEYVIVTLGRNVANKYRLSDQKHVGGWTSRDHMTSGVIYDKSQDSYVGIFNNNAIKIWKEDGDNLDKVKKFKFPVNMLKLITRQDQPPLLLFTNGNCASLPYAIDNRKTYESRSLIKDSEAIVDTACYTANGTNYICYVVKNNHDNYEIINCPVREELGDLERPKLNKIKVSRPDDVHVVGEVISTKDRNPTVYFLWSDSKMTKYDLSTRSWKTIGTVPWISTATTVSIAWMWKWHLILFGSNMHQDGAIIVGYNVLLGVGFCKYPMKMYTKGAKLYCFNDRIILEASNHIGVLPYELDINRNLSNLLGSHEIPGDDFTEIADWGTPTQLEIDVSDKIKEHLTQGLPERTICSQLVTPLLEKNNIGDIHEVINEFKDIPESVVVQLLRYAIKSLDANNVDVTDYKTFAGFCRSHKSEEAFSLLMQIFGITFSDALLIPYLRNVLALDDALFLMSYITYLLANPENIVDADYESKLLDWCTLLMDAFYQQYLITKDVKVTNVLESTQKVVLNIVKHLNIIDNTMITLHKFLSGKETVNEELLTYSIEMMQI